MRLAGKPVTVQHKEVAGMLLYERSLSGGIIANFGSAGGPMRVNARYSGMIGALIFVFAAACVAEGAGAQEETVPLPDYRTEGQFAVERALDGRRSVRDFRDTPLELETLSQLCWAMQGISDEARQLRTAPSAGALYGLDTYVVVGSGEGIEPGLYRYEPGDHELVLQHSGDIRSAVASAALGQLWIADAPVVFVIVGVPERLESRYGERAERYTTLEAGHAAQNLALQAVALEMGTTMVGAFADSELRDIVGASHDHLPLYIIPVGHPDL